MIKHFSSGLTYSSKTNVCIDKSISCLPTENELLKKDTIVVSTKSLDDFPNCNKKLTQEDKNGIRHMLESYLHINELESDFIQITDGFKKSILESLSKSNNCMLPCFNVVCDEDDQPEGSFAIIDIGGSTLRVCVVKFLGNNKAECIINKSWLINDQNKHLDPPFFNWITGNFKSVIDSNIIDSLKDSKGNIKLGITWSFPINQNDAPNKGKISDLGKGFSMDNSFKDKDLKDIFENAFAKANIPVEVYSIVNDSTSVFIAGSYFNNSKLGLVQGTGLNSCFLADSSLLSDAKRKALPGTFNDTKFLVNAEASFLGYHLQKYMTDVDIKFNNLWSLMDDEFVIPPHLTTETYGVFQPLEIITSGRYIPEIIRLLGIEEFNSTDSNNCLKLFSEALPKDSLTAEILSRLYKCENLESFKIILREVAPVKHVTSEDLTNLRIIADTVIHRASIILASYIIALLEFTGFSGVPTLDISVIGSMLQYFPGYKEKVLEVLNFEAHNQKLPKISFNFIEDSSIYGASISAYVNKKRMNLD